MKKVLITGANSYVGINIEKWLLKEKDKYQVETLDMKDSNWNVFDFNGFDVVFHVAGIAHVSRKKNMKDLYFKVNRDLTIEVAHKAKESGVKQFIFMSSMIVYNSKDSVITPETQPNPDNFYGLSKLQAEEGILKLQENSFNVCILRPPMIYGPNSKGNFPKLINLAKKSFIFPKYVNKRSCLYIDNLSLFVEKCIEKASKGIYKPQNIEYFSTFGIVKQTRECLGKKGWYPRIFNIFIRMTRRFIPFVRKIFGDYYYEDSSIDYVGFVGFEESLSKTISK